MNNGKIEYYLSPKGENPVMDFIESLSKRQKAKIFRVFMTFEQYGLISIIPHTKKLSGTPLWEIRILGQDNIRILYVTVETNSIFVLHGFIKKKQKTPQREIQIALFRHKERFAI